MVRMNPQTGNSDAPTPFQRFDVDGATYRYLDTPAVIGPDYARLPLVLRLLADNAVRHMRGAEREQALQALRLWLDTGTSDAEIAYQPGRVLMHDTTSTPALVDIAAMRDALREAGADPSLLNPVLPVDVSVDHSLAVEAYAQPDAADLNLQHELRRNAERYRFLRWSSAALDNVRIHPPGTGIMHTINLEQLATVVRTRQDGAQTEVQPDMMLGTDSHTPMVNGLGVLGWGVGGLEAQTVMFGMPTMLRIPEVIGVRFTGALQAGATATDLALTVTKRLRDLGVSGEFVEYHGPGVATLPAGSRCVIANMAPEYGATTGYFPIDEATLRYLRETGRAPSHLRLIEAYAKRLGIWLDPQAQPRYTRVLHIDLDQVRMHVAGPRRPQDLLDYGETAAALARLDFRPAAAAPAGMPPHPVAIAAITSCTNTTDPRLLVAAGLVARKARALGLRVPAWVKTSLAPGSPAAVRYLQRAGLLEDLSAVGFDIVGYGCTTCIGNSGPLPQAIAAAMRAGAIHPVAVLSGNRNFSGRIHPDLDLGFLMSPPLVVAFALAGDAQRDLSRAAVCQTPDGRPVSIADLWPAADEIEQALAASQQVDDYREAFRIASANPAWHALQAPTTPCFPWDPASTALRRPPFAAADGQCQLGRYSAYPLLVLGDDVTTDHLSPASAIPPDSPVADYLVERGDDRDDLNVFASRRGNWEVMGRGAFYAKSLKNLLCPQAPVGQTLHVPSGELLTVWDAAQRYRNAGDAVVLVAGARFGTGSSRDWAAKGQRLVGIRAVLAVSFERIHRSNLIGMGILPLRLPQGVDPGTLALAAGDRIEIDAQPAALAPRAAVPVRILRRDGSHQDLQAIAAVETQLEVDLLHAGGVIPAILRDTLQKH
jgi:aconitate hydratase